MQGELGRRCTMSGLSNWCDASRMCKKLDCAQPDFHKRLNMLLLQIRHGRCISEGDKHNYLLQPQPETALGCCEHPFFLGHGWPSLLAASRWPSNALIQQRFGGRCLS
jgi:hypothetical protein